MYSPILIYDLAKLRIADDLRQAERDQLVRRAGESRHTGIDAVPFRQRLIRLFGPFTPVGRAGASA